MTPALSIYLDLIRFLAANIVFIGHISGQRFTAGILWQVGPFKDEAVVIFFVLSGFVISYVSDARENTVETYTLARMSRIYSVVMPSIIATFFLDTIGTSLHPDLYESWWGFRHDNKIYQFSLAPLFLNQIWYMELPVGSCLPYWSICFEVWYYIIFGVFLFAQGAVRAVLVGMVCLLVGPRITASMSLWLIGVAAYNLRKNLPPDTRFVGLLGPITPVLWGLYHLYLEPSTIGMVPGWLGTPNLLHDAIVALLFAAHLVGFDQLGAWFQPLLYAARGPIRWAAGATFTVYLLHLPVAQFLITVVPWPPSSEITRIIMMPGVLAILFLAAELTERRKSAWREWLVQLRGHVRSSL